MSTTTAASHASLPAEAAPQQIALPATAWWVRGDAPVRLSEAVVPLVDGRAAMLAMCVAFLTARKSIWLADWSIYPALRLVRGRDLRAGPDGTPEQRDLIARLRAAGLDDEAIALWESGRLMVRDVLGFAARRGVQVRVLLWDPFNPFGLMHIVNNPKAARREFLARGVECRLDKSSRSPFHVAQALHQKCAAIDEHLGFLGGVDLTVERTGDFDRWDVPAHPYAFPLRSTTLGPAPHPWHDAHVLVAGSAARDIAFNIAERWSEAEGSFWHLLTPPLKHLAQRLFSGAAHRSAQALSYEVPRILPAGQATGIPPAPPTGPVAVGGRESAAGASGASGAPGAPGASAPLIPVQVVRTIPPLTYRFAPEGISGIAWAYIHAIRRARRYIYLESQYLWLEGYHGTNIWRLGWPSPKMERFLIELALAAERGVTIALVLPDHPNVGRHYTGDTLGWLMQRAATTGAADRLHVFTLGASTRGAHGKANYRPIYVHAKVGIVDDTWATLGSANLNSRGMAHDAEINLAVLDGEFAGGLRRALWAEHAGLLADARTGWPAPARLPLAQVNRREDHAGIVPLMRLVQPATYLPPTPGGDGARPHPDVAALEDPLAGIELLERQANENLERMQRGEPLVGQILPYLRRSEGRAHSLAVDVEAGYLDVLAAQAEGRSAHRRRRYRRYV